MNTFEAIVLGVIQGLSEFLPISSSGHLVIAQHLIGFSEPPISYDILLHFATFLSTLIILRKRVWEILMAVPRFPRFCSSLFQKGHLAIAEDLPSWVLLLVFVTTLVTGILGLTFENVFKSAFSSLKTVAISLSLTGLLLWFTQRIDQKKPKTAARMSISDALWIGLAQTLAIVPGISRSGATISAGLYRGLDRQLAGEYAFLISLPAILGALLLELRHGFTSLGSSWAVAWLGFLFAFLVGLVALHFLLKWIRAGKLSWFSYYCFAASLFTGYLAWF